MFRRLNNKMKTLAVAITIGGVLLGTGGTTLALDKVIKEGGFLEEVKGEKNRTSPPSQLPPKTKSKEPENTSEDQSGQQENYGGWHLSI